jgi:hypothetical protein
VIVRSRGGFTVQSRRGVRHRIAVDDSRFTKLSKLIKLAGFQERNSGIVSAVVCVLCATQYFDAEIRIDTQRTAEKTLC